MPAAPLVAQRVSLHREVPAVQTHTCEKSRQDYLRETERERERERERAGKAVEKKDDTPI